MDESLSIEVIVEQSSATVAYPWSFSDTDEPRRIRLHGATADKDIGSVVVTICEYNTIATADTPETVFENILADANLVLPGGLQFSRDGVPVVVPGCCSGIEEWREWFGMLDGGHPRGVVTIRVRGWNYAGKHTGCGRAKERAPPSSTWIERRLLTCCVVRKQTYGGSC